VKTVSQVDQVGQDWAVGWDEIDKEWAKRLGDPVEEAKEEKKEDKKQEVEKDDATLDPVMPLNCDN